MSDRKRDGLGGPIGPPNLVPVMNLVTILIPFLLLTVTFVHLAVVDSSLPAITPGPRSTDGGLGLTVAITDRGFIVGGESAILGADQPPLTDLAAARERTPTVPRDPDGGYPFDALTALLVQVKTEFPDERNVILMPEPEVPFDVIIATMDATRDHVPAGGQRRELLFPFPVLSGGIALE